MIKLERDRLRKIADQYAASTWGPDKDGDNLHARLMDRFHNAANTDVVRGLLDNADELDDLCTCEHISGGATCCAQELAPENFCDGCRTHVRLQGIRRP